MRRIYPTINIPASKSKFAAILDKSINIYLKRISQVEGAFDTEIVECTKIRTAFKLYCDLTNSDLIHVKLDKNDWNEIANIEIARIVCRLLDEMKPNPQGAYERFITYVKDRPGHDRRYAIDATKIEKELAWRPSETFVSGIRKTVSWYLENTAWIASVKNKFSQELLIRI